jgi:arginyl-tRNA synthetase
MLKQQLALALNKTAKELYQKELKADLHLSPSPEFGDFSSPLPLTLAKLLNKNPLEVAEEMAGKIGSLPYVERATASKPGFVNFFINHAELLKALGTSAATEAAPQQITIEHTSVNPNKSAHIGHLRNASLGDSLAKILTAVGHKIQVQNYIDDTGVQVADIVLAEKVFNTTWETDGQSQEADDFYWELYTRIQQQLADNPELVVQKEAVMKAMEVVNSPEYLRSLSLARLIVGRHLATFARFGIHYDLLVWERDILTSQLWDKTFELLKEKRVVIKRDSGKHTGAWVVEFGESEDEDKILVRSNGVPTYVAKDIAYALWKFGQGGVALPVAEYDFDGVSVATTQAGTESSSRGTILGNADQAITVIDIGQSYTQEVLKHSINLLGFEKKSRGYTHLSYEKVKLSPQSFEALGLTTNEDKKSHSMSGRQGIGVKVNDLLDKMTELLLKDHPELDAATALKLAIGSIRYYMLRFRPNREMVFDFEEAMQTRGNTGIYLQYAYARANNILANLPSQEKSVLTQIELNEAEKNLVLALSRFDEVLEEAALVHDPSLMAEYAYELAGTFAKFYETSPVLKAEPEILAQRVILVKHYLAVTSKVLDLIGVPVLAKI